VKDQSKDRRRSRDAIDSENEQRDDEEYQQRSEPKVPFDAPEADVLEQSQSWGDDETRDRPKIPEDAPEADVLEQSRSSGYDDQDRRDD
jgi:hypothetical protein